MAETTAAWPDGGRAVEITEANNGSVAAGELHQEAAATPLTLEHLLYALFAVLGFAVRFAVLGASPLAPFEAAQSWPAALAARATAVPGAPTPTSALFYGLQSWVFFLFGANDITARLLPALAGAAIVLLPWFWRRWLGRSAALTAALLLAVDPWLTALARRADSVGLTLLLGLLALTALWHHAQGDAALHRLRWERTLAVSVALLLVSGPQAWSWLPVLLLFGALYWRSGFSVQRSTWVWFAGALVLGATGLLARPDAAGSVGASLSAWLGQWSGAASSGAASSGAASGGAGNQLAGSAAGFDLRWPLLRMAADQPLVLVFGVVGLILLATGRALPGKAQDARRQALFLGLWLVWGVVLLALPGRSAFVLPMVGLPLLLATAAAIGYLIDLPLHEVGGLELTLLLAVSTILVIAGAVWIAAVVHSSLYDTRLIVTALLLVALTLLVWVMFGLWAGWMAAAKAAGLFFAAVLLLASLRSTQLLAHREGMMEPDGLFAVVALPEARLLATDIQRLSAIRRGDPHEAPLQIVTAGQPPDPLLAWLLRDMRNLSWVPAPQPTPQDAAPTTDGSLPPSVQARTPLVIAPPGMEKDKALAGLLGSSYALTMRWTPADLPTMPPVDQPPAANGLPASELEHLRADQAWQQATRPLLEWWIYRTVKTPPPVQKVTLWAAPWNQ